MSKMRDEAEARKMLNAYVGQKSECYQYAQGETRAWDVAMILLDALEEMCAGCDIDCDDPNLICDHHKLKKAIKQAEEV